MKQCQVAISMTLMKLALCSLHLKWFVWQQFRQICQARGPSLVLRAASPAASAGKTDSVKHFSQTHSFLSILQLRKQSLNFLLICLHWEKKSESDEVEMKCNLTVHDALLLIRATPLCSLLLGSSQVPLQWRLTCFTLCGWDHQCKVGEIVTGLLVFEPFRPLRPLISQ